MRPKDVLKALIEGKIEIEEAESKLRLLFLKTIFEEGGILDIGREERTGIPEAIMCEGKKAQDVLRFVKTFAQEKGKVLATRINNAQLRLLKKNLPKGLRLRFYKDAKIAVVEKEGYSSPSSNAKVGIISAGTVDIPVAEEAHITAKELGCKVFTAYDVGVAGIHRIVEPLSFMMKEGVHVFVVVAGMEGTLPTLVKSLVNKLVIGVPTSCGYGVGKGGIAALNTMLQSCAPGLVVVNIDNGFGAGATAALVAKQMCK